MRPLAESQLQRDAVEGPLADELGIGCGMEKRARKEKKIKKAHFPVGGGETTRRVYNGKLNIPRK